MTNQLNFELPFRINYTQKSKHGIGLNLAEWTDGMQNLSRHCNSYTDIQDENTKVSNHLQAPFSFLIIFA